MLDNLYVRVDRNLAFKVLAITEASLANEIRVGAVIDTVNDTAIIASLSGTKLTEHMWEADKSLDKLQLGHEFIRVTQ